MDTIAAITRRDWRKRSMIFLISVGRSSLLSYLFELGAVFWVGWKRTRYGAIIFGIMFHLGIATLMKDLIYFSLQMLTSYIFYVDHKHGLQGLKYFYERIGKDTTEIDENLRVSFQQKKHLHKMRVFN